MTTAAETKAQEIKRRWPCDVTPNGVAFEWGLAGPNGAWFCLLREPHHTDADMRAARNYLRVQRDVVSLKTVRDEPKEET